MKPEELKRLQAAKKQREKEKKDAETNARRHAANVRVRQRAQVHIQGMTTKIANEDVGVGGLSLAHASIQLSSRANLLACYTCLFCSIRHSHISKAQISSDALARFSSSSFQGEQRYQDPPFQVLQCHHLQQDHMSPSMYTSTTPPPQKRMPALLLSMEQSHQMDTSSKRHGELLDIAQLIYVE